jgi:uncharacterized integral membrane protein
MTNGNNVPSIGQWMLYLIVAGIPLVGFIMLIVWMLDNTNPARKNWASAMLIWMLIVYVLVFMFWGTIFAMMASGMSGGYPTTM